MSEEFNIEKVFSGEFGRALGTSIARGISEQMAKQTETLVKSLTAEKASVGTVASWNMIHGRGSILGAAAVGLEPDVISAQMQWMGLGDYIPVRGTQFYELLVPYITGTEPTSSTEPTNECDDCISGETEACIQYFPLGRVCRETQDLSIDRVIERLNRGDINLTLLNDQLGSDSPWHPGDSLTSGTQIMQIATAWALLFELPPLFMQALVPMVWTGNPTNNTIGDGYREFRGLNLLINTGHVDAITNTTCPALDSDVKNFAYGDMTSTTNPSLWETLEMMEYYVFTNARRQRLTPVRHALVMRPEPWQILSNLIPAQSIMEALLTYAAAAGITPNLDLRAVVEERDRYRQTMTVPLNGRMIPVILDDGIEELNNANDANLAAGEYASSIYIVPLSYLGNRDGVYIEYKDFRQIRSEIAAAPGQIISDFYMPSSDGRFAWNAVKNGWCYKIQAKIEPRILLRPPQLAARVDHVKYIPLQHTRSPDPDSPYFFKGGVSTRPATGSYYV